MTNFTFVDAGTRQVLEAMPDAVLLVDYHGTIRLANQVTEQVFGYARNDLLGRPIEVLDPERFRQRHVDQRQAYADHPHRREPPATSCTLASSDSRRKVCSAKPQHGSTARPNLNCRAAHVI